MSRIIVPSGQPIPFKHLPMAGYYLRTETSSQVWVITGVQQYSRPQGIVLHADFQNQSEPPPEVLNFDFSKNFILMIFNGFRGGYGTQMTIKEIIQEKGTVYISAHLDDPLGGPSIPIESSQYNVLAISKTNLIQFGEITFILLDNTGKERASVTAEVPR